VDGAYAVVKFQGKECDLPMSAGKDDPSSLLSDCRILRKDDLQVIKGSNAPKVPDCFQKTPKKISIPETGRILALTVDTQGLCFITWMEIVCYVSARWSYREVTHTPLLPYNF